MTVTLKINGKEHEGWKSARITRGLDRAASDFSLTVTEKVPGTTAAPKILPGAACELYADGEHVITGYIDDVDLRYDGNSRALSFNGRSKTGDLVDCSAINTPGQWSDVNLQKIASDIAGKYNVSVSVSEPGDNFPTFRLQPAERAFDAIERAARIRAMMVTDDPTGRLIITRASSERASTQILCKPGNEKNNVLSASATFSHRDRFRTYIVKSQSAGTDDLYGADAASPSAEASDSGIARPRTLIIQAELQGQTGSNRDRAEFEAGVREGKSLNAGYTLRGWRQASGKLWKPNIVVPVDDDLNRIKGDFLISEVTFTLDQSGQRVDLTVVPPEAYKLIPSSKRGKNTDPLAQYL